VKKEKALFEIKVRLAFVAFGLLLIYSGRDAVHRGVFWVERYNAYTGNIDLASSLGYFYVGIICVVLALLPWRAIGRSLEPFLPRLKRPRRPR
jgi:hypothetical protein